LFVIERSSRRPSRANSSTKSKAAEPEKPKVIRRSEPRIYSVFVDGVALDRATKRLGKRVNYEALVKSLCVGGSADIARYYTLLPEEDDARQSAFFDAIAGAGLDVIKKRLPPKGLNRQVSTDVEMATDMLSVVLGRKDACSASLAIASGNYSVVPRSSRFSGTKEKQPAAPLDNSTSGNKDVKFKHSIIVVCPSKEISYAINLCRHFGAETITADFGSIIGRDILKGAEKWVDLTFSDSIWMPVKEKKTPSLTAST
jgi:hypothetical protein